MALPVEVTATTETKPGVYTTEFWVTLFGALVTGADLFGVAELVPDTWAAIGLAVITGLYSVSRGVAKQGQPYVPEVVEAELAARLATENDELDA